MSTYSLQKTHYHHMLKNSHWIHSYQHLSMRLSIHGSICNVSFILSCAHYSCLSTVGVRNGFDIILHIAQIYNCMQRGNDIDMLHATCTQSSPGSLAYVVVLECCRRCVCLLLWVSTLWCQSFFLSFFFLSKSSYKINGPKWMFKVSQLRMADFKSNQRNLQQSEQKHWFDYDKECVKFWRGFVFYIYVCTYPHSTCIFSNCVKQKLGNWSCTLILFTQSFWKSYVSFQK